MNHSQVSQLHSMAQPAYQPDETSETSIPHLIGQIYEIAPTPIRIRMLEQLLRPLGILSLVAVANGLFAKIRFRSGWPEMHMQPEDVQNVHVNEVIALVGHVQQISVEVIDSLAQFLMGSPLAKSSGATAALLTELKKRSGTRWVNDNEFGDSLSVTST